MMGVESFLDLGSVCISSDGTRIISGSEDKNVKIWDILSGECFSILKGHTNIVTSVCISNDGSVIISGSDDKTIKIWDVLSEECLNTLSGTQHQFVSVVMELELHLAH